VKAGAVLAILDARAESMPQAWVEALGNGRAGMVAQ
jgi:hypothetical protein